MEKNLQRSDILRGNYIYPTDLVKLIPTKHVLARLEERSMGMDFLPTVVRVTPDNIHSAKTYDDKHLHSVVIRLSYSNTKWIFLCVNPFDGGLKTIWFDEKRTTNSKNRRQAIRNDRRENNIRGAP